MTFVARLLKDGYPPLAEEGYLIFLAVSMNGRPVTNGTANASGDVRLSFVAPGEGWVSCFAQARTPEGKELLRTPEEEPNKWRRNVQIQGGAMVAPEECRPGVPEPDDFDAYWAAERKAVLTRMITGLSFRTHTTIGSSLTIPTDPFTDTKPGVRTTVRSWRNIRST